MQKIIIALALVAAFVACASAQVYLSGASYASPYSSIYGAAYVPSAHYAAYPAYSTYGAYGAYPAYGNAVLLKK